MVAAAWGGGGARAGPPIRPAKQKCTHIFCTPRVWDDGAGPCGDGDARRRRGRAGGTATAGPGAMAGGGVGPMAGHRLASGRRACPCTCVKVLCFLLSLSSSGAFNAATGGQTGRPIDADGGLGVFREVVWAPWPPKRRNSGPRRMRRAAEGGRGKRGRMDGQTIKLFHKSH